MRQRCLPILLLLSMLPGIAGLSAGNVLCIGSHGHIAIEPAMICGAGTCISIGRIDKGQPLPQPAVFPPPNCGRCNDIPGAPSLLSADRPHDAFAHRQIQMVSLMPVVIGGLASPPMGDMPGRPADTPVHSPVPSLTVVLLI